MCINMYVCSFMRIYFDYGALQPSGFVDMYIFVSEIVCGN